MTAASHFNPYEARLYKPAPFSARASGYCFRGSHIYDGHSIDSKESYESLD